MSKVNNITEEQLAELMNEWTSADRKTLKKIPLDEKEYDALHLKCLQMIGELGELANEPLETDKGKFAIEGVLIYDFLRHTKYVWEDTALFFYKLYNLMYNGN